MPFSILRTFVLLISGIFTTGCVTSALDINTKAIEPIPAKLVRDMRAKSMSPNEPILVRIFKQESELEIWKRSKNGRFALLKTYPMCRWSGKLGPKKASGDRQAPEGFYHVSYGMLNPKSQYHLSFNLGYPNRLESALGYTGEALMVHGACSSSGCFAMTDEGVSEIYAVAREALKGGQSAFQVQSFPFRMTAKNMTANRGDPNYAYWTNLKAGYDIFELTKRQPSISYCGRRYAFNADLPATANPLSECPDQISESMHTPEANERDNTATRQSGTVGAALSYVDGGMHPTFRRLLARDGAESMAKRTSRTLVPISRPKAALADTYLPGKR